MGSLFNLIESHSEWLNGFIMAGVILILIGVQNVTRKDLRQYLTSQKHRHLVDEIIAWGIFYIIFGVLIIGSTTISLYSYFR